MPGRPSRVPTGQALARLVRSSPGSSAAGTGSCGPCLPVPMQRGLVQDPPAEHPSAVPSPERVPGLLAKAPVQPAPGGAAPARVGEPEAVQGRAQAPEPIALELAEPAALVQQPPDSRRNRWCCPGATESKTPGAQYSELRLRPGALPCRQSSGAWGLPEARRNCVAHWLPGRAPPALAGKPGPGTAAAAEPAVPPGRGHPANSTGHPRAAARRNTALPRVAERHRRSWRTRHGRVVQVRLVPSSAPPRQDAAAVPERQLGPVLRRAQQPQQNLQPW